MALKVQLEADPDPLVRYSTKEGRSGLFDAELDNAEIFLALPHEARLAKVRLLEGRGEEIAKIIDYALDHHLKDGRVSELELFELLVDYVRKPSFRKHLEGDEWRHQYDGYGEHLAGKENETLWRLAPKCPGILANFLIESLPHAAGLSRGVPDDVMNALTDQQLQLLLFRSDVGMVDLRQKLFKDCGKERNGVKSAAICHHFSIKNDDFAEILGQPEKEKTAALRQLNNAHDLRLCIYEAVQDHLKKSDAWGAYEDSGLVKIIMERKLAQLEPGWYRDDELRQLRLYHLARRAVPVKESDHSYPPRGEVAFFAEHIVLGDTWATFVAFDTKWRSLSDAAARPLEKYLPHLDGIDPEIEEDADVDEDKGSGDSALSSKIASQIEQRLAEVLVTLQEHRKGINVQEVSVDAARDTETAEGGLSDRRALHKLGSLAVDAEIRSLYRGDGGDTARQVFSKRGQRTPYHFLLTKMADGAIEYAITARKSQEDFEESILPAAMAVCRDLRGCFHRYDSKDTSDAAFTCWNHVPAVELNWKKLPYLSRHDLETVTGEYLRPPCQ